VIIVHVGSMKKCDINEDYVKSSRLDSIETERIHSSENHFAAEAEVDMWKPFPLRGEKEERLYPF
jgi:hypothetical protein